MPKVTVVIPNYNHASYLPKRLESVLGQTFRDIEVLFLDDASTDNSREVFEPYAADTRVRAIFNERNSGSTFVQWNRGFREAKGEYIWIAESDDEADDSLLAELVDRLDHHPNVGLAYCQSRIVDTDGTVLPPPSPGLDPERWKSDFVNDGRDECARYLINANTIPNASAVVLRRSVVERVGPAPADFKLSGDWMMWARMMLAADVAFVARPLNSFRTHAQTVRNKYWRSSRDTQEMARIKLEIARGLGPRLSRARRAEVAETLAWVWLDSLVQGPEPYRFALRSHMKVLGMIAALDRRGLSVVALHGVRQFVRGVRLETPARALLRTVARRSSDSPSAHPPNP
jgi:hypothetical protein